MNVYEVEQRSPDWYTLRRGRLTSSCAADMLATLKDPKKEAAGRRNLRIRLVLERLTGRTLESNYVSPAMQQGMEREADARLLYETQIGRVLYIAGFCAHETLMAGCSPDGQVNDFEGLVEAKCPLPATHLEYLRTGKVPEEYYRQVLHQLWITGARWCDWISYAPEFPEPLQLKLVRIFRTDEQMKSYELLVRQFLAECDREYEEIQAMTSVEAATAS